MTKANVSTPGFEETLATHGFRLLRKKPAVLQVNVGKRCNLTCVHCHVNAGPRRKEIMTRETVEGILDWVEPTDIPVVDLTGGAPEMIPDFRYFVEALKKQNRHRHIIDRSNLTILLEPGYEWLAGFLARHEVEIVASMPCYQAENVNAQRGNGVFDASIRALKLLNELGYGRKQELPLNLVYNPVGAGLPPDQGELEADYKRELYRHFGIVFNALYTITNMPIARFLTYLRRNGQVNAYQRLLVDHFNPAAVEGLMCRDTISVDWRGRVFDCDFNQMLDLPMEDGRRRYLWDLDAGALEGRPIHLADHCFGCTAGSGSSCTGALG